MKPNDMFFLPGDPQGWVRHERSSTAFGRAGNLQRLKQKRVLLQKLRRRTRGLVWKRLLLWKFYNYEESLPWHKLLSCQDMQKALILSNHWGLNEFFSLTFMYTHSLVQAYSTLRMLRPKSKSKPKSSQGLSVGRMRSNLSKEEPGVSFHLPALVVDLQLKVLIVPWPTKSPRKFRLTLSITLFGFQSSFSHWQNKRKVQKKKEK